VKASGYGTWSGSAAGAQLPEAGCLFGILKDLCALYDASVIHRDTVMDKTAYRHNVRCRRDLVKTLVDLRCVLVPEQAEELLNFKKQLVRVSEYILNSLDKALATYEGNFLLPAEQDIRKEARACERKLIDLQVEGALLEHRLMRTRFVSIQCKLLENEDWDCLPPEDVEFLRQICREHDGNIAEIDLAQEYEDNFPNGNGACASGQDLADLSIDDLKRWHTHVQRQIQLQTCLAEPVGLHGEGMGYRSIEEKIEALGRLMRPIPAKADDVAASDNATLEVYEGLEASIFVPLLEAPDLPDASDWGQHLDRLEELKGKLKKERKSDENLA